MGVAAADMEGEAEGVAAALREAVAVEDEVEVGDVVPLPVAEAVAVEVTVADEEPVDEAVALFVPDAAGEPEGDGEPEELGDAADETDGDGEPEGLPVADEVAVDVTVAEDEPDEVAVADEDLVAEEELEDDEVALDVPDAAGEPEGDGLALRGVPVRPWKPLGLPPETPTEIKALIKQADRACAYFEAVQLAGGGKAVEGFQLDGLGAYRPASRIGAVRAPDSISPRVEITSLPRCCSGPAAKPISALPFCGPTVPSPAP